MSEAVFEEAVVRMAANPTFAEAVRNAGDEALAGLDLTDDERAQLHDLSVEPAGAGAEELGARQSKSGLIGLGGLEHLGAHHVAATSPDIPAPPPPPPRHRSSAPARARPGCLWPWVGTGTNVYRSSQYDRGEWIYSNGLMQARGANSDGLHRTDYYSAFGSASDASTISRDLYLALTYDFFGSHRATHNGDYQLPTDKTKWPDFTSDLAEVRMAVEGGQLYVRFLWNSMPRPDAQIATLTFATAGATTAARHVAGRCSAGRRSPWQAR